MSTTSSKTPVPLTVQQVSVTYPGSAEPALSQVEFSIAPGTITVLIGPNGSGKSTLIKAILGLIPFQGQISIFGQSIHQPGASSIGYVPQRLELDLSFPVSVLEMLQFTQTTPDLARIKTVLNQVGAGELLSHPLAILSGGQLQRVLLARALINHPKLLVLDEPESGIDIGGEQTIYTLIQGLIKTQHISAIIASHELDIVYGYADQVVCLNQTMLCSGSPTESLTQATFEKLYGHSLKLYDHHQTNCPEHGPNQQTSQPKGDS